MLNNYEWRGETEKLEEAKNKMPKLESADIEEDTSIRMVFVTASPVLTNEVKQYYSNLKARLSQTLQLRELKT